MNRNVILFIVCILTLIIFAGYASNFLVVKPRMVKRYNVSKSQIPDLTMDVNFALPFIAIGNYKGTRDLYIENVDFVAFSFFDIYQKNLKYKKEPLRLAK